MILGARGLSDSQREFLDAKSVVRHLLTADSPSALLATHRRELFPDEVFADLFSAGCGPAQHLAEVVASVIAADPAGLPNSTTVYVVKV